MGSVRVAPQSIGMNEGRLIRYPCVCIRHIGSNAGNMLESNSPNWSVMTQVEGDGKGPWWEDDGTLVFVILGLPVVGLTVIGVLSLIGINTSDFPDMFSAEFFVTDLFVKLLTLPIGFIAIRAILRRANE